MTRYMLLFYANERAGMALPKERMAQAIDDLRAYSETLSKANALVDGGALGPTGKAVSVSTVGGDLQVHNGPYAETQEQLGGFMMIQAASMDEATKWAAQCPAATWGHVEIREIFQA